jgi:hypothetical protein
LPLAQFAAVREDAVSGFPDFSGAVFSGGRVDSRDARFSGGEVHFSDAEFSGGKVHFSDAESSGVEVSSGRRGVLRREGRLHNGAWLAAPALVLVRGTAAT